MGEITLKSGKVVKIDVSDMTVAEWRKFAGPTGTVADENAVVAKCTGLSITEIESLNYRNEFKPIIHAIVKSAQEPLADPL